MQWGFELESFDSIVLSGVCRGYRGLSISFFSVPGIEHLRGFERFYKTCFFKKEEIDSLERFIDKLGKLKLSLNRNILASLMK